jgi:hypothetical protein
LNDDEVPPSSQTAKWPGHDEGDLPWPRTDRGDQKIADTDAETNPQGARRLTACTATSQESPPPATFRDDHDHRQGGRRPN